MKYPHRACPVCLSADHEFIFRQQLSAYSAGALMAGYDIDLCKFCGAAYADDIPTQREFDTYYAEMSKYEYDQRDGLPSQSDQARFAEVVSAVAPHISRDASIVDVGCATGGLLAEFKKNGFPNVSGFDPSPACAQAARRIYDIKVVAAAIHDLEKIDDRFDCILLTGVLEHLCDVDESLRLLSPLLNPGGSMYIEVPDVTRYDRWFSAPFQFFSMEHVNFFSPGSLTNLMGRHGLDQVRINRAKRFLSPKAVEPAIGGIFKRREDDTPRPIEFDTETRPALLSYVEASRRVEERINAIIAELARSGEPIAVWGAGTHTLRLLETSELPKANIVAFIDSNSRYQDKTLNGVPIVAPDRFSDRAPAILISSHAAEAEIANAIANRLQWPNRVVRLYGDIPEEAPTA